MGLEQSYKAPVEKDLMMTILFINIQRLDS